MVRRRFFLSLSLSPSNGLTFDPTVLALRRLGFGISELGERRLKGLEMPEMLSLLWPKSLKDRIKSAGDKEDKVQTEVYECVDSCRPLCP
jgi:hypothetical protein